MDERVAVGVDVGGTFTDGVVWDGQRLIVRKLPTTSDQSEAVTATVGGIATGPLLHGTTVATNALLEGKGARTALITTEGFEDVIEIGRQDRPTLYDSNADRPPILIPSQLRHGYRSGAGLCDFLEGARPDSIAISLLDSYQDGADEESIAGVVAGWDPTLPVSVSSRVNPEFREYERTATTVLNAYLSPVVAEYLGNLEHRLQRQVLVMQSSGGLTSTKGAAALAASILVSGPAGGVVAAAACGARHGWDRVISFDMGGTSTDVCRIENGVPQIGIGRTPGGYVCRLPSIAVHTIGAGGGSIAWLDDGGGLRVGPQSAGAWPGPASYLRGGTLPTVTDANLVQGRLGTSLAGDTNLDVHAAHEALRSIGSVIGFTDKEVAAGIIEIVNAHMEAAIRRVSIEEGVDPRGAALVAFGGAGGLHATALARSLGMAAVLIPPHAGVLSALGMLLSPLRHDLAQSIVGLDPAVLDDVIGNLEIRARQELRDLLAIDASSVLVTVDCRYRGQAHETAVEYRLDSGRLLADFESAHLAQNGFITPGVAVETVNARVAAIAPALLEWSSISGPMTPGTLLAGPRLIETPDATTFLADGEEAVVLGDGTLQITW